MKKKTFCGAKFEDPQNPPSPLKPTASMGAPRLSLLIPATSLEVSKPILRFSSSLEALMRLMIMVYYSERTQIEISKRERLTWVQESPASSCPLNGFIHTVTFLPATMCVNTHRVLTCSEAYLRLGVQCFIWGIGT